MPSTGATIAAVLATRGNNNALLVAVMSKAALGFGLFVPIPTCAKPTEQMIKTKHVTIFFILLLLCNIIRYVMYYFILAQKNKSLTIAFQLLSHYVAVVVVAFL
ncbi:hypothetical protein FLB_14750 [Flavobacterium succinicans]|uniref:Uncharacterized protein n=1 Tax=Flavobacterium succinicans TaxID=29536 RepID=A0A199XRT9_9FLAO|nr:hypothetical protein FLB_14750 [Flavobacterium succinicans]